MGYKLLITASALNELNEIVDYISNNLDNPFAAADFLDKVEECYDRLKDNPKIYQCCDHQNFKEKGYRKVIIKNYILIYRIDEKTNNVYILHFVYGRQDYNSII